MALHLPQESKMGFLKEASFKLRGKESEEKEGVQFLAGAMKGGERWMKEVFLILLLITSTFCNYLLKTVCTFMTSSIGRRAFL